MLEESSKQKTESREQKEKTNIKVTINKIHNSHGYDYSLGGER